MIINNGNNNKLADNCSVSPHFCCVWVLLNRVWASHRVQGVMSFLTFAKLERIICDRYQADHCWSVCLRATERPLRCMFWERVYSVLSCSLVSFYFFWLDIGGGMFMGETAHSDCLGMNVCVCGSRDSPAQPTGELIWGCTSPLDCHDLSLCSSSF